MPVEAHIRFARFVSIPDFYGPETCFEWSGSRDRYGYGQFINERGRRVFAHRFSYQNAGAPLHPRLGVLHRCDNPSCVRPSHLFHGDQLANVRDMIKKGRDHRGDAKRGEAAPNATITQETASAIITALRHAPRSKSGRIKRGWIGFIAGCFDTTHAVVIKISCGKSWLHLGESK